MTPRRALNLEEEAFEEIRATVLDGPNARVVRFLLDQKWVERVRLNFLSDARGSLPSRTAARRSGPD